MPQYPTFDMSSAYSVDVAVLLDVVVSTTFWGQMFGHWILIGLKQSVMGQQP